MSNYNVDTDPPLPSINTENLTINLSSLSLNTPAQTPLPESPAANYNKNGRSYIDPAVNTSPRTSSGPSRRSSAHGTSDKSPVSPRLRRRSSNNSLTQKSSNQATTSKGNPPRSPSHSNYYPSAVIEETIPYTAASIAATYFNKELALHASPEIKKPDTVVLVHDACYGHRYSRPKTSKTTLSLIVERPERLQACVLGIASAYVRLAGLYAEGRCPPHPEREPDGDIPFRIQKTSRSVSITSTAVTNVHGTKWMQELKTMCDAAEAKLASGGKELTRPETPNGPVAGKPRLHEGDLYLCKESLRAFEGALGGVLDGVDHVFGQGSTTKKAFVCIRPPGHHCSADLPSGFCWINNVHVGIEHAALAHGLTHAAIIDIDLHHGDGSQSITWDRNAKAAKAAKNAPISKKTSIGYFSLHDINSYPCEWGDKEKVQNASVCLDNAHGQNIWNVHLQPWSTEEEFWKIYGDQYKILIAKARDYLRRQTERINKTYPNVEPKAAIFISAGFDASEYEGEGMQRHGTNVPTEFYARISSELALLAEETATGCQGRVISVLEGGYSNRALTSGAMSHVTGLVLKKAPVSITDVNSNTAGAMMDHSTDLPTFEPTWWSSQSLLQLETLQQPTAAPAAPRKTKTVDPPTYTSPTQSFTAKIIDPSKIRSLSGTIQAANRSRPPTPPLPDVDWATAAYELSKLLIPQDRQISSCKHEELAEPRVKREKVPPTSRAPAEPAPEQMRLRGRTGKATHRESEAVNLTTKAGPEENRRRTLSDLPSSSINESQIMHIDSANASQDSNGMQPSSMLPPDASSAAHGKRRPSTSSIDSQSRPSSRPSTSGPELKVGRTRRSSASRPELTKAQSYTDEASVPKLSKTLASVRDSSPVQDGSSNAAELEKPQPADADVDKLTSGVKKITLKMAKPEPLATNDPNKTEKPPPRTARKSVAPVNSTKPSAPRNTNSRPAKAHAKTKKAQDSTVAASQQSALNDTSAVGNPVVLASSEDKLDSNFSTDSTSKIGDTLIPPSSLLPNDKSHIGAINNEEISVGSDDIIKEGSDAPNDPRQAPPAAVSSEFIPYIPDGLSSTPEQPHVKTSELTWLPPNTSTPTETPVKKTKEDLPVFTPQSKIPFALPLHNAPVNNTLQPGPASKPDGLNEDVTMQATSNDKAEGTTRSVWDVPDTPRTQQ